MELSAMIKLNKVDDVYNFVKTCRAYESDINVSQKRWNIDGKSVLGMFSLSLDEPVNVEIITSDGKEATDFYKAISKYRAE